MTSLIQSAKMNARDPYAYLKDLFTRLPTQPANRNRRTTAAPLATLALSEQSKRWIEVGKSLGANPTAAVLCPRCRRAALSVTD
jgi:transposase IS66-like protein